MTNLVSCMDFERKQFEEIFGSADKFKGMNERLETLEGQTVVLAFFEPSARTHTSFELAAKRLGAEVIDFRVGDVVPANRGGNLADTIRMLDKYSDCIVLRHKYDGAAKFASNFTKKPIINAGDGMQEHPSQAILDLYTVRESLGRIDKLNFAFVGDLRYARTVNSMLYALTKFTPGKVFLVSPPQLRARREVLSQLNYKYEELEDLSSVADKVNVLYVTKIPQERFPDGAEYTKAKNRYLLSKYMADELKDNAVIIGPIPHAGETGWNADRDERVKYFDEASNSVYVRMAILDKLLWWHKWTK